MELKGQFVPGATEDPPSPIALNLGVLTPGEIRDIDWSDLLQTGRISPSVTQGSVSLTYSGSEGAVTGRYIGISANKAYGYYSALESFAGHAVSELYWTVTEDWQPILTVATDSRSGYDRADLYWGVSRSARRVSSGSPVLHG